MYGKVFESLYESTLALHGPWQAMALWPHMIALANKHGEVDMPLEMIARKTTLPVEIVRTAIEALSQPDPTSRSQLEDGRRIVLIDPAGRPWGWRLVNYKHYANVRNEVERREKKAEWWRENRGKPLDKNSTDSTELDNSANASASTSTPIPPGVTRKVWEDWLTYRGRMKDTTIEYQFKQLAKWKEKGLDLDALITRSITNGWRGLFDKDVAQIAGKRRLPE